MWTEAAGVISPATSGDTVEVPGAFGTPSISTADAGGGWQTQISPGALTVNDGAALAVSLDSSVATVLLRGDSGGSITPKIQALDFDATPQALNLSILDLEVNGAAGSAGDVLTSNGAGAAPTWQAPSGGASPSSATPQSIGTASAGSSLDYARGDHVHAGNVTGLGDRFTALPLQAASQFAAAGTRDIQAAIDAHTSGNAAVILAAPGSYPGATVTIGTGKFNVAVCGAAGQPFGGTITSLSAGRGLTVSGTATRIRIQNIQIEGLTTWATSGAGVHRIDRCQLVGGLTVSGFSAGTQLVITDCEIGGTVTVPAGFLGVILFEHCSFNTGYTISNAASAAQVVIGNSSGITSATGVTLQGACSNPSGIVTTYANGAAIITPALQALGATVPATNALPYFTSGSSAGTTTFTAAGREIAATASSGSAGQVLTSAGGGGSPPTWTTISGGSGLPTSQTWTLNFAPTSLAYPTLAASGWTLSGFTSGGIQQDTAGNFYELLTPTGIASFAPTSLVPTISTPWEVEFDALFTGTSLDGVFGISVNEGSTGKRWRMFYSTSSGTFQHINSSGAASNLSTPYDVQGNQRIIMGIQSEPRASRAYFANGQSVGLVNPDGNQVGSGPAAYAFGNTSGTASTTPIRVYAARVLHNSRGTAPPYARIPWPPVQP